MAPAAWCGYAITTEAARRCGWAAPTLRGCPMKTIVVAALIGLAIFSAPAPAQTHKKSSLRIDPVRFDYVPPKDAKHQPIYDALRKHRVLENLSVLLSPLRLPRRLTLKVEGCDGVANAYYSEDTVSVCYEYLDYILQSAPKETTAL